MSEITSQGALRLQPMVCGTGTGTTDPPPAVCGTTELRDGIRREVKKGPMSCHVQLINCQCRATKNMQLLE